MNNTDLMSRLAALDPQIDDDFGDSELRIQRDLFENITAGAVRSRRERSVRRRVFVLAGAAVLVTVVIIVTLTITRAPLRVSPQALANGTLSAEDLATWTGTPEPAPTTSRVESACGSILVHEPGASGQATTALADVRGAVTSGIVSVGGFVGYCVLGHDPDPVFVLLADPTYVAPVMRADQVSLGASGSHGAPNGYQFAEGSVGSSVRSVTIHQDGLDIAASVGGGYWIAWWPLTDAQATDATVTGPFTVTTTDGKVATYSADQIAAQ